MAPGPDASGGTIDETRDEDSACELGAPVPMLLRSAYSDYRVLKEPFHRITESASIDRALRVQVTTSSCADSVNIAFRFSLRDVGAGKHDLSYWAEYTRMQILGLKTVAPAQKSMLGFLGFLSELPVHAADADQVSVCLDETIPDQDGCPWRSGGGYSVDLLRNGKLLTITATTDSSH